MSLLPLRLALLVLAGVLCPSAVSGQRSGLDEATITSVNPSYGSLAGGTQITIRGSGFMRDGTSGSTTVTIGGRTCSEVTYYTTDSTFVCSTPPGSGVEPLAMTLVGTGYGSYAQCSVCTFVYSSVLTPYLDSVFNPAVVAGGSLLYFGLMYGSYYSQYNDWVGGSRCSVGADFNTSLDDAGIGGGIGYDVAQSCTVSDQSAGRYPFTINLLPTPDPDTLQQLTFPTYGYGNATVNPSSYSVDEHGSVYSVVQLPVITGLSAAQGATTGGQLLTITGTSFATGCSGVEVRLGGSLATPVSCAVDRLVVLTGANTASNDREVAAAALGGYGGNGYAYGVGSTGLVWQGGLSLFGFNQQQGIYGEQTMVGLLTVPYTASYQFLMTSRNSAAFRLSNSSVPQFQQTLLTFGDEQGGADPYLLHPVQQSVWVSLKAGTPYYFAISLNTFLFRVGVRIHNANNSGSSATTPFLASDNDNHKLYQSVPAYLRVAVGVSIQREVQTITFTGAIGGVFQLNANGNSGQVPFPSSGPSDATTLSAIANIAQATSGCYAGFIGVVGFYTTGTATLASGVGFNVTFNCPTVSVRPLMTIQNIGLNSSGTLSWKVVHTQNPSAPLAGSIRAGYTAPGAATVWGLLVPFGTAIDTTMQSAINAVGLSTAHVVVKEQDGPVSGLQGDGLTYVVQITSTVGDTSSNWSFDGSALTGSSPTISVTVMQTGSLDRFYPMIPAEWTSVAADQSQAVVSVNGLRSVCGVGAGTADLQTWMATNVPSVFACHYSTNPALVPAIVSVSQSTAPAGTLLTITGSGFDASAAANNIVSFVPLFTAYTAFPTASAIQATATSLVFKVPNLSGGQYRLSVQVTTAGSDDQTAAPVLFTFVAAYNTPSPLVLTGSIAGGALLIVTGSGFQVPQQLAFSGNDSFVETANYSAVGGDVVLIGGQVCELEDVSFTMLICRVPAPASQVGQTAAVTINGNALATYTYAQSATPHVTAISPPQVSAAVTTVLTITGTGFVVPAAYPSYFFSVDLDNPYNFSAVGHAATFDDSLFAQFAVHLNSRSCNVLTASATQITCQLTRSNPPNPLTTQLTATPSVYVMGLGYAQAGENQVEIALQVNSVTPHIGSLAGGQYVTIAGAGFVQQSTIVVTIDILADKQLSDYPSMTTQSATTHEMRLMSLTEGSVPASQRFFPLQVEHAAPHLKTNQPKTSEDALNAVMDAMHHRSHKQATKISASTRTWHTMSNFKWTGLSVPCAITSVAYNQIVCFTQHTGTLPSNFTGSGYSSIVGLVHVTINQIDSLCATADPSQSCLYAFDVAHTPTITTVSPTSGGAGTMLTIAGTLLNSALSVVLVGYDTCANVVQTATQITCTVPGNTAATVPVQVLFSVGFAANTSLLTFTRQLSISSLSQSSGSYGGGTTVTLAGLGFSAVAKDNNLTIGGLPGIVVSSTATQLVFTTPPALYATQDTASALLLTVAGYYYAAYTYPNVNSQSAYPVLGDENPAMLSSTTTSASFTYTASLTPTLTAVTPQAGGSGTAITVTGTGFTAATTVEIGGIACTSITAQTATSLACTVQTTPAGTYPVNVIVPGQGLAYVDPSHVAATSFTSSLSVTGISPVSSSYGGGVNITVTGAGFGILSSQTIVTVCNTNCTVVSATYNQIICTTDALTTLDRIQRYGPPQVTIAQPYGGASLIGSLGSTPLSQLANLNDDDPQTGVTATINGAWVGMDMGASSLLALTQVRWYAPYGRAQAKTAGGTFQSSLDGTNWNTLFKVSAFPSEGWNYVNLVNQTAGTTVASVTSAQRYFRYVAPNNVQLAMQEIEWQGYRVAAVSNTVTSNDVTQCPVAVTVVAQDPLESLQVNGAMYANGFLKTPFTIGFSLSGSPTISSISPNNGSSLGGTSITFTGTGFTSTLANTHVALSGYPCLVSSVSSTQVVCTTTARSFIGMSPTGTQISLIAGSAGRALLVQQGGVSGVPLVNPTLPLFRYLDRWSAINTWAFDEPPLPGDTVVIPQGQTILMDVSPNLFVLFVQGVLVWDNQDGLTLDATYIWVNGGTFQIGTEQTPFTMKATITLHGDRLNTIELPYIGAKCLAVDGVGMGIFGTTYAPFARYGSDANGGARSDFYDNMNGIGVLDFHGVPRARVWTMVTPNTYAAGSNTIQVDEVVDFKQGEVLVLTDSSWSHNVEEVVVQSLSADGKTITLASPLALPHVSERHTIEGRDVDMRCHVAILSRNIVIQGDSSSHAQQYGSHVMMMAGSIMRIENIETRYCGQGYNLGRYCLHFHMAGDVHMSYLKSNSIHDGYQRASTAHGVEYATIFNEVAYNIKGHNFFVEDGAERQNTFEANLAINVQILTTMLQSDLMPAGFWTSSPANTWIHNVVSGSTNAGFWFELASSPSGPSAGANLCPNFMPIGQFYNNTFTHGSVGVQVYAQLLPMVEPCLGGQSQPADSFIDSTTVYRMGNGYNMKHVGPNVQIRNSVVVECNSAVDWSNLDGGYSTSPAQVSNSLVVGSVVPGVWNGAVNGFWLPQSEYVKISGITYVNLPAGAILSCKQCDTAAQMNQGGFTIWTSGLKFVNTPIRFLSVFPYKEIIFDQDGSLTGTASGTLTARWDFNINPHCSAALGGIVCDSSVRVRKLKIMYPLPQGLWSSELNVTSYDAQGNFVGTQLVLYKPQDFSGWLLPVVTGYTYSFNFTYGQQPLDFSLLVFRYGETDVVSHSIIDSAHEWVVVKFPYHTYRWEFEVDYPGDPSIGLAVQTQYGSTSVAWNNYTAGSSSCLPTWSQPFGTGCNDRDHQVYSMVLNNQGNPALGFNMYQALVQALECPYSGCQDIPAPVVSTTYGLWSQSSTWIAMNLSVPVAGATVTIPSTSWIVFDLPNAPAYDQINIQGKLTFSDTADLELIASRIYVTGDFEIGSAAAPFQHKATITLTGEYTSPILLVDNSQADTVGNKVLAVFGNASFHGQPVVNTWTTLAATAAVGATSFTVSGSVADWTVGSSIVVSSTEYDSKQREQLTVTAISGQTVTFTPALTHSHFAGNVDYSAKENVFFAAKVGLLTRNIVVRGSMTASSLANAWGAHIVVSEIPSVAATTKYLPVGKLDFNYVQLDHFGQYVTSPAVLLHFFSGADNPTNEYSVNYWARHTVATTQAAAVASTRTSLVGCSFSNLYSQGLLVQGAPNMVLQANVFDTTYTNAIKMDYAATNAVISGNLIVNAQRASTDVADGHHPIAAIYMLSQPLVFTNNVVAGAADAALTFNAPSCSATPAFSFEAHSSPMGVWMLPGLLEGTTCIQLSNVKLWKHGFIAIYTVDQDYNLIVQNAVIADSHEGLHYNGYSNQANLWVIVTNSIFFGTTPMSSCSQSLTCSGVATINDLLGASSTCGSTFGSGWRHVGIVGSAYYGRGRTCQIDGAASFGAAAQWTCDPINQFVYTCALPADARYGLPATTYGYTNITNVTFAYWTANECGGSLKSAAISYNPASETWSPEMWAAGITWYKSDMDARINMALTPGSGNCLHGCDGWDNFIINDVDGSLLAGTAGVAPGNVVVTAGSQVVTNNPRCSFQVGWDGYICIQQKWRQLLVNLHASGNRVNPVYTNTIVTSQLNVTGFSIGPMDDGCSLMMYYPLANTLVLEGTQTDLIPTGPMPALAILVVHSSDPTERFLISLFYTQPMQTLAYVGGVLGTQLTTRFPTAADPPGTFAFSPQARRAYVVISGGYGKEFTLQTSGLISVTLGLAVDFATFDGANVVYYMALLLSIDPTTIKVADVHAGSTIASYFISGTPNVTGNATLNTAYLTNVSNNLVGIVQSGAFTQATGYTVTHLSVTPPSIDGTGNNTVSYTPPPSALTSAEVAGIATGVVAGVVIAVVIVLIFVLCGGVYVVRQRRLAAASKSVYSAKEGVELQQHQDKLADKMKAKRPPPPIVARKESLPSSTFASSSQSMPDSSPPLQGLSSNAASRRDSFATLNLDAPVEDDGRRYVCIEAYHPRFPQELELQVGDVLTKASVASDSWYVATNERTGDRGAVLKGHITPMKVKPQFASAAFVPSDATSSQFSLSSAPPLPAASTTSTDVNVTRHTYVPTGDDTIETPAVFYPPAARAPVINLDRWERSRSNRNSLKVGDTLSGLEPVSPSPNSPSPMPRDSPSPLPNASDEEEKEAGEETGKRGSGVHRRVLSMERRWSGNNQ